MARRPSPAPVAVTARPPSDRYPQYVLGLVSLNAFMGVLDQSAVNVGFPILAVTFDVSVAIVSWVSLTHMITLVACLTIFGRLADLVGSKRVYVAGLAVYLLGALLATLAPSGHSGSPRPRSAW